MPLRREFKFKIFHILSDSMNQIIHGFRSVGGSIEYGMIHWNDIMIILKIIFKNILILYYKDIYIGDRYFSITMVFSDIFHFYIYDWENLFSGKGWDIFIGFNLLIILDIMI